jgi:hypothetical protein
MRSYGKVAPTFWTGQTGKHLRAMGPEIQLVALYLVTCQSSHMSGLFYMPLPILCHETGMPLEGALKALARLSEAGFAHYDEASEVVFVPEMASYQIGPVLLSKDLRHKGLITYLEIYRKSKFYKDFYSRYQNCFNLPKQAPSKPLRRGRVRARAELELELEQEQDAPKPPEGDSPLFPAALNNPQFIEAWSEWKRYRAETRHPLSPTSESIQIQKLAEEGCQAAIERIRRSIANTWRGLWFKDDSPKPNGPPVESTAERHARIARETKERQEKYNSRPPGEVPKLSKNHRG